MSAQCSQDGDFGRALRARRIAGVTGLRSTGNFFALKGIGKNVKSARCPWAKYQRRWCAT